MANLGQRACRVCNKIDCEHLRAPKEGWHKKSSGKGKYDWDWQKVRAAKLAMTPYCELRERCAGTVAVLVDHRIPRRLRPDLRLDINNLQSCCRACHDSKTAREMRGELKPDERPSSVPMTGPITF